MSVWLAAPCRLFHDTIVARGKLSLGIIFRTMPVQLSGPGSCRACCPAPGGTAAVSEGAGFLPPCVLAAVMAGVMVGGALCEPGSELPLQHGCRVRCCAAPLCTPGCLDSWLGCFLRLFSNGKNGGGSPPPWAGVPLFQWPHTGPHSGLLPALRFIVVGLWSGIMGLEIWNKKAGAFLSRRFLCR